MNTTSFTLLERLRRPDEADAWDRFARLYTPLLYQWARGVRFPLQDAADLVQDVLTVLLQKLPEFTYDQSKSFRSWLRTVALNKWRENTRKHSVPLAKLDPANLPDQAGSENTAAFEEAEYRQYLVRRALEVLQADFQPSTWKACWECLVDGKTADQVAKELGTTTNAVYLAKSRVLRRLHQELKGLLD